MKSVNEMSVQELEAMRLEMIKRQEKDEKARQRAKEYREKNAEKTREWSERARVRSLLLARKAKEMGITVDDDEIDEYLAGK